MHAFIHKLLVAFSEYLSELLVNQSYGVVWIIDLLLDAKIKSLILQFHAVIPASIIRVRLIGHVTDSQVLGLDELPHSAAFQVPPEVDIPLNEDPLELLIDVITSLLINFSSPRPVLILDTQSLDLIVDSQLALIQLDPVLFDVGSNRIEASLHLGVISQSLDHIGDPLLRLQLL